MIKHCIVFEFQPLQWGAEVSHKGTNLKIDSLVSEDWSLAALSAPLASSEWKTQVMAHRVQTFPLKQTNVTGKA